LVELSWHYSTAGVSLKPRFLSFALYVLYIHVLMIVWCQTGCTRLETLSSLNLKWLQILQQRAFPLHVAKKWGTAFPLRKMRERLFMRQCSIVKPVLPPSESLWVYLFWGCLFLAVMCKQNRKYITYCNLNWSTASVGVRQTASGDCEVTCGTDNWKMVYFNNVAVKLLKWKACLKAASLCQHFVQSMSLKVADKRYENTRFTMRQPRLPLPPQLQFRRDLKTALFQSSYHSVQLPDRL